MSRIKRPARLGAAVAATLAATLVFGTASPAFAAESETDAAPDRVVLTPTQHPATSQAFTWRTGADVTDGWVELREAGSGGAWRKAGAYVNDPLSGENEVEVRTHSAVMTNLSPATTYEYTVGNGDERSDVWSFTTAGNAGNPFTFLYFGDAQNQLSSTWGPVVEAAYDHYPDAIGTVNAGDLINRSNSSEWTDWFDGMDGYSQTTNVIAAPGNHEYTDDSFMRHWKSNFEYPANGPDWSGDAGMTDAERQEAAYRTHMAEVLTETAYFTDYQGVRFIALNASRSQARSLFTPEDLPSCLIGCPDPVGLWLDMQANWLDDILANNPNQWAVAVFHQPVFSTATGRDEADLRAAWLPVFQRNDIDLVLMGHDHTYARGYVNADATDTPGITTGPVYTVAVAGPKYYAMQPEDNNVWTQNGATQVVRAGHTSTFQGITVDDNTLRYESIVAAKWNGEEDSTTDVPVGGLLDSFTITKFADGTKVVTEDGIEIPEWGDVDGPAEPGQQDPDPVTEEEPAGTPANAPLAHVNTGALTAPTVQGPVAFDEANGILYAGDATADGTGLIEAIDVATDEVIRTFETGAPVTALSFSPIEGGLLLAANAGPENTGFANGYATNPAFFGAPILDDNIPMPAPIRDLGIDAGAGLVYFSLAVGAVVTVDIDAGDIAGQKDFGPGLRNLRVDEATGNIYVIVDSDEGATLSIYPGAFRGEAIREYDLAAGASDIDLDVNAGLAYVSHADGFSAVDVLSGAVRFEGAAISGNNVLGLATDGTGKRVYVATESGVNEVSRAMAPEVTESPVPVAIDAGEDAVLFAAATAVPAATVAWQVREGDEWVDVEGATTTTLTVNPEKTTQYRALFTNEIIGETFSTASATATVTVAEPQGAEDDDTGAEEDDAGGDADDTGTPTEAPTPVDSTELTDDTRGSVTGATVHGLTVTVTLTGVADGELVAAHLHSTPVFLGWNEVAGGAFTVTVPEGTAGTHRISVQNQAGELIGWASAVFAAAPDAGGSTPDVQPDTAPNVSDADLAATGSMSTMMLTALAALLLAAGVAIVLVRRTRQ